MSDGKVWYSRLQFRVNPGSPNEGLDLGFAIEFTTSKYWVVGLAVRAGLDDKYLAALDDLSRKLLQERVAVLTREVEQTLNKAGEPGDALSILAASNPWSIHVTAPRSLKLSASEQKASDKVTTEKVAEDYIFKVFEVASSVRECAFHEPSACVQDDEESVEVQPMWMLPLKTVMRPLSGLHA
jgi:hypothetical protein